MTAEQQVTVTEQEKEKARKWFERGKVVADTRNYDYAIECYVGGLEIWPEALEEGHMPLRAVGMARKQAKGKPAGFAESLKRGTGGKDPLRNMLNAEFLLAKDPFNINHMEAMFINAGKAGLHTVANWIGDTYFDAVLNEKKIGPTRLVKVRDIFERMGDEMEDEGHAAEAVAAYEKALRAVDILTKMKPDNGEYLKSRAHLSGKLTISRGKYDQEGQDFRDSLLDKDKQAALHDMDRGVQNDDRLAQLIDNARQDFLAHQDVPSKLTVLVDLLLKRERDEDDAEAIKLLTAYHDQTGSYRFKMRADDVKQRQFRRKARALQQKLKADPDNKELLEAGKKLKAEAMQFDIETGKERVANYPTDHRMRFQYAQSLFKAGMFDEAIPEFQAARADPRNRKASNLFIGRCFYEKQHYGPAVDVLKQLLSSHETSGDDISKEASYWLGRAHEGAGKIDDALQVYNQIIQWDYNYRDVRSRIDALRKTDDAG